MMRLARRIWFLFRRHRLEREMQEEMQAHREMMAAGDQARFGNMLVLREQCRDQWGWAWFDALQRDVAYAFRMVRKSPGFSAVVVLVLALGIGLNAALFSIAYPLFVRPLSYPHADRLYSLCMVAYSVACRTREIGIRISLGARSEHILRGVMRSAVVPVFCGIAIGVPGALALAHSIRSFLFGVEAADAPTLATSAALLLISAAVAAFIPGRRASRIDPGVTLRNE